MSLIRKRKHNMPQLKTAALPDLIFVVLFFFITVTHMREVTLKVKYRVPEGTELTKLTRKSAVTYIYIGPPADNMATGGNAGTRIQINDKYADLPAVTDFMAEERARMAPEDADVMSVSIKADRNTEMGLISDVRQALRQAGVPRISFSAVKKDGKRH